MTRLKKFKPKLVTETFPARLQRDPQEINYGNCMRWAFTAYYMFEGVELWDTCGHAFIKFRGKFYDSEKLEGVTDWRDLPANYDGHLNCNGGSSKAKRRTVKYFKKWWRDNNHVRPEWELYRQLAKNTVKKYA